MGEKSIPVHIEMDNLRKNHLAKLKALLKKHEDRKNVIVKEREVAQARLDEEFDQKFKRVNDEHNEEYVQVRNDFKSAVAKLKKRCDHRHSDGSSAVMNLPEGAVCIVCGRPITKEERKEKGL